MLLKKKNQQQHNPAPQPSAPEEKKSKQAAQPADPQPNAPNEKKSENAGDKPNEAK